MLLWSLRHSPTIHLCLMAESISTLIIIRSSSDPSTDHSLSTNPWSRSPMWSSDVGYNNRSIEISVSTINVQFCPCSQLCPSKMKPAPRPRRGPTARATPATSASSWAGPPRAPAPPASASAVSVSIQKPLTFVRSVVTNHSNNVKSKVQTIHYSVFEHLSRTEQEEHIQYSVLFSIHYIFKDQIYLVFGKIWVFWQHSWSMPMVSQSQCHIIILFHAVSSTCGGTTSVNGTYFQNPGYSSTYNE